MMLKMIRIGVLVCLVAALDVSAGWTAPASDSKPYQLPFIGWVVVVIFFASTALVPWVGAVLGRAGSVLSGTITGVFVALITSLFAGYQIGLILFAFLAPVGLVLDVLVTNNYRRSETKKIKPAWWAGGTWMDAR